MEKITDPAKLMAATTYNAAADHFDDGPLAFWDRYGRRTIERLRLKPGSVVLDVGCGSGASAVPAGKVVLEDFDLPNIASEIAILNAVVAEQFSHGPMLVEERDEKERIKAANEWETALRPYREIIDNYVVIGVDLAERLLAAHFERSGGYEE